MRRKTHKLAARRHARRFVLSLKLATLAAALSGCATMAEPRLIGRGCQDSPSPIIYANEESDFPICQFIERNKA